MRVTMALVVLFCSFCFSVRAGNEPKYLSPLATGGAPECPEHVGVRNSKSEIAKMTGTAIYITGVAKRDDSGCRQSAELHIERKNSTGAYDLPDANQQDFSIADFSPDGSTLLIFAERNEESPNEDFRDVQVAVVPIDSGVMQWRNVWDILQWLDCDATIEPQGFGNDGNLVLLARPSVWHGHRRPNCVSEEGLYSVGLSDGSIKHLAADADIKQHGGSSGGPCQTCEKDPDLAGACFTVHGRMAMYNGTPTYRIWRIGTDRILGVHDFIVPESIASNLTGDNVAFGDFYVCPFTLQKPGEMQIVCVESASEVIYKNW